MSASALTLRHTVATLAYRAAKAVRDMPAEAAVYRPSADSRTAAEILAHMGDLFDWALSMANGKAAWKDSKPLDEWSAECDRFFAALQKFDERLAADEPIACDVNRLFQGPVADALTHTGQINILRRLAGAAVKAENYAVAKIGEGRIAPSEQAPPVREF